MDALPLTLKQVGLVVKQGKLVEGRCYGFIRFAI
jgi:hypothetical protein